MSDMTIDEFRILVARLIDRAQMWQKEDDPNLEAELRSETNKLEAEVIAAWQKRGA